ncbi:hypothetical protein [Pseudomonas cichorii]|nr:hypothetical protein [Pseudomonas cichorii]
MGISVPYLSGIGKVASGGGKRVGAPLLLQHVQVLDMCCLEG